MIENNKLIIEVNKNYFRPAEVELCQIRQVAKTKLGWEAGVETLASIMIDL